MRINNYNILFVTADNVNPLSGGIARMTYLLAAELHKRGHKCVSAYLHPSNQVVPNDGVFTHEILLQEGDNSRQISDIITTDKIDVIIVQGVDALMNQEIVFLRKGVEQQSRRTALLFVFHQMPGYELHRTDVGVLTHKLFGKAWKKSLKQLVMQSILYVNKSPVQKKLHNKYHIPYQMADKVILLSPSYIADFDMLAHGNEKSKYVSIPNMLTFSSVEMPVMKKHEVIMVSRMDEDSKRIKTALQIWNRLPKDLLDQDWKLVIVGDGEDLEYYKKFVNSKQIRNVQFEGQQNPLSYYQQASIFMMTSAFEGWPMTIMEAQQNGCVPVVFDSFKAVYDLIENGKNGIIVPDGNQQMFAEQLAQLMRNPERQETMAKAGLQACQRFSKERVTDQWLKLFDILFAAPHNS